MLWSSGLVDDFAPTPPIKSVQKNLYHRQYWKATVYSVKFHVGGFIIINLKKYEDLDKTHWAGG